MKITKAEWNKYKNTMSQLSDKASKEFADWVNLNGGWETVDRQLMAEVAYTIASKYAEGSSTLAAEMYDAIAKAEKVNVPPAETVSDVDFGQVAKAVNGALKHSTNDDFCSSPVGRAVKQAGADTMLKNASRDQAEFAWIPSGDSCAFCLTLAANGWQKASKKTTNGEHADHIHTNCDCQFVIRFSKSTKVEGYDPSEYQKIYYDAEGNTSEEKIKSIRKAIEEGKIPLYTKENTKEQSSKKQFKSSYENATSIKEAEEKANHFVDKNRFGATGISYDGISLDVANKINKTIWDFYDTYNVDKFGGVIAPRGNTKEGKLIENATAAYSPIRNSFLLNRKSLKDVKTAEKALFEEAEAVNDYIKHPEKYDLTKMSLRGQNVLKKSLVSGRGTVPETIEDAINHELGHSIEKIVPNSSELKARMPQFAEKISGYACESWGEYVAESFASYKKGENVIDPEMIKAFEELERK